MVNNETAAPRQIKANTASRAGRAHKPIQIAQRDPADPLVARRQLGRPGQNQRHAQVTQGPTEIDSLTSRRRSRAHQGLSSGEGRSRDSSPVFGRDRRSGLPCHAEVTGVSGGAPNLGFLRLPKEVRTRCASTLAVMASSRDDDLNWLYGRGRSAASRSRPRCCRPRRPSAVLLERPVHRTAAGRRPCRLGSSGTTAAAPAVAAPTTPARMGAAAGATRSSGTGGPPAPRPQAAQTALGRPERPSWSSASSSRSSCCG